MHDIVKAELLQLTVTFSKNTAATSCIATTTSLVLGLALAIWASQTLTRSRR